MNHTDERIKKLAEKGLTLAQIARKIGRPFDIDRVIKGLQRMGCGNPDCGDTCKDKDDDN